MLFGHREGELAVPSPARSARAVGGVGWLGLAAPSSGSHVERHWSPPKAGLLSPTGHLREPKRARAIGARLR
jgi:hypothetical protein